MPARTFLGLYFPVALAVVAFIIPLAVTARPATQADLDTMCNAGIVNAKAGQDWNPDDPNIGKEAGEIKKWLVQHSTVDVVPACFNAVFAKNLKRFMEAAAAAGGGKIPVITSGYRTEADFNTLKQMQQAGAPIKMTSSSKGSNHSYGIAADFDNLTPPNSNTMPQPNDPRYAQLKWMRDNAGKFGLATIGTDDAAHFQLASGQKGSTTCSGGPKGVHPHPNSNVVVKASPLPGCGTGTDTGTTKTPEAAPKTPPGTPYAPPPGLPPPAGQLPPSSQQPFAPSQLLSSAQTPMQYMSPMQYSQQNPVTPFTQQTTPLITANTNVSASGTLAMLADFTDSYVQEPTIAEKMLKLVYQNASSSSTTDTQIFLSEKTVAVKGKEGSSDSASSFDASKASETFVSSDLAYSGQYTDPANASMSSWSSWFENLQAQLLRIIQALLPFGQR